MLESIEYTNIDSWLAGPNWETAVETLTLSFVKHNVAIVKLPEGCMVDDINRGLFEVAELTSAEASPGPAAMRPPSQQEPYLFRDPSPRCIPPSPGVVRAHPGKLVCEHRLGVNYTSEPQISLGPCFTTLERTARCVLAGLCRSCHLRVHTSTFMQLLEDIPLRKNAQSCSTLQAAKHVRATPEAGASNSPPLAWPLAQEGTTAPGLVAVIKSQPAQDPDRGGPCSKLQVKNRTGTWIDVMLKEDEVAVFLGRTAQVASAGLLKASTYRLVGELQKGTGHQNLEFHLCARPDADLDLSKQLEAAGHDLPERHEDGMNDLVRQFSAVLTPPNHTPPNRIQGRGVSVESLEMRTIPSTELQKRSRKRESGELPRALSPVTRSGKVARTSAGLINKEHRLRGRSSDASGGAMDEDGESAEEGEEEELGEDVLCVTVDGKGANTSRFVTLRMIYEATETEVALRTHPKTSLARLFEVFCDTVGANLSTVKFMYNGERLNGSHTCRQLSNLDDPIFVSHVDC